jgi:WD40 repeat protein
MCKLGMTGQHDKAVGDLFLAKGQLIGVGRMCALNIPMKTYYRFGYPNSGLAIHAASLTARNRETNKLVSIHDGLHRSEISVAKVSINGQVLVTGCIDSTVRVWKYENSKFKLRATFCGHDGWKITCVDVSNVFGFIVTACAAGVVLIWDLRTLTFVRRLSHSFKDEAESAKGHVRAATSVSINQTTGNIVTLVGPHLSLFDVNGNLLGTENSLGAMPTCAVATDCPEWQEEGIVAVTGHVTGEIRFWSLDYATGEVAVQYMMIDIEHTCEITALRITGAERQDTLLIGDTSGKMSVCKTVQLENMSSKELNEIVTELRTIKKMSFEDRESSGGDGPAAGLRAGMDGAAAGLRSFLPGQGDTGTM